MAKGWIEAAGIVTLAALMPSAARAERVVEIRSYHLAPGRREAFHRRFVREALPLLERARIDVVAYGPSLHDDDSYYLIRAYPDLEERARSEDSFYGSAAWREGPREATLADIESYNTLVVRVDETTIRGLRKRTAPKEEPVAADIDQLTRLNEDYIRSVQTGDVRRFSEILAKDFLCSLPDGSLVDREGFLEQTARPVAISNLEAHDVNVRLMGDFAIIHARTTFRTAEGREASGRYTDVWARREGRWLAVSAHVTRN
jgi:ketosteroid isomerase-like protein